jgi:hypothetical protein
MGAEDVFPTEVPDDPTSPIDPLDEDTAERLLSGRLDPLDAPPPYAAVARLLRAAASPPSPDELAGEPAALAAFRSLHARPRRGVGGRSRRRLVAVALAGTLVAGGLWTARGAALIPGVGSPTGGAAAGGSGSSVSGPGGTGSGGSGGSGAHGVEPGALRVAGLETVGVPGKRPSPGPTGRDRTHDAKPDRPGKPAKPRPAKPSNAKPAKPKPSNAKPARPKSSKPKPGKPTPATGKTSEGGKGRSSTGSAT